jgi:acetamidase/formamidase
MWMSKKTLYIVLKMEIEKYGWNIINIPSTTLGPYCVAGRKDGRLLVMKVLGVVAKETDGNSFVAELYMQGFPALEYKWEDQTTILEPMTHESHTIGMSAFVNGLINMVMD